MAKRRKVTKLNRRIAASHKNITFGRRTEIVSGKTPFITKQTRFTGAKTQSGGRGYDRYGNPLKGRKGRKSKSGKASTATRSSRDTRGITRRTLDLLNTGKEFKKNPKDFIKSRFKKFIGLKYIAYRVSKKEKAKAKAEKARLKAEKGKAREEKRAEKEAKKKQPNKKKTKSPRVSKPKSNYARVSKPSSGDPYAYAKNASANAQKARKGKRPKAGKPVKQAYVGARRSEAARKAWKTKRTKSKFAIRGRK